jgi:hypothetical protein
MKDELEGDNDFSPKRVMKEHFIDLNLNNKARLGYSEDRYESSC